MTARVQTRSLRLLLLASLVCGCRAEGGSKPGAAPAELASGSVVYPPAGMAGRFVDLAFSIVEQQPGPNGAERLRARSTDHEKPLSLGVEVGGSWQPENVGADIAHVVCRGSVALLREGSDGDALLLTLDELYGTRLAPRGQTPRAEFRATTPCAPRGLAEGKRTFTLVWEPGPSRDYAELELVIDEAAHRVELRERSPSYRAAIVRALGRF